MEGVGARLGRSSTRYGPATVFTGPVRKWKKRWIPYTPPNNSSNGANHNHNHNHHHSAANNGAANGGNGSHLLLYKWAPITPSQNGANGTGNGNGKSHVENNDDSKDDVVVGDDEQQRRKRKFKYIPVAVLEEQKNEASEHGEDEAKPMETETETETDGMEPTSKGDGFDGKPDINDVPAEESQVHERNPLERQDLNESTLDLSLGLKAHDGENDSDSKTNQKKDG